MAYLGEYIGVGWENEPSQRTPVNAYNLGIMEDGIKRLFAYLIAGGGIGPGTNGREIELRNSGEYIQWRYSGEEDWTNLVSLADLKGEKGDNYILTEEDIEEIASKVKVATSADKITYDDTETKLGAENVQDAIGNLSEQKVDKQDGYSMVSDSEKQAWNNKSDFSGSYNDLTDKPEIPEGADLTGYATEDYVKDYAQPKGNYLTEHQDLSGYALKEEIPTVPEKLPNPNALTFTGAVTGSYDGSEPVSIEIPSGGGSGGDEKEWKKIGTFTANDNINPLIIDKDENGNDFACTEFRLRLKLCYFWLSSNVNCNRTIHFYGDNKKWVELALQNIPNGFAEAIKGDSVDNATPNFKHPVVLDITTHCGLLVGEALGQSLNNDVFVMEASTYRNRGIVHTAKCFTQIKFGLGHPTNLIMAGSTVEVWGR